VTDQLHDLVERVANLEATVLELDDAIPPITKDQLPAGDGAPPQAGDQPARFTDPVEWMDRVVAPLWTGPRSWCPRWWEHPEAYHRIVWLWRSWEAAMTAQERDGNAMATWLLTADLHRDVLQADSGPFANCRAGRHGMPAAMLPITDRTPGGATSDVTPLTAEHRFFASQQPPDPEGGADEQ
jgi:hypothetical protein